jgi:hypothetical protein
MRARENKDASRTRDLLPRVGDPETQLRGDPDTQRVKSGVGVLSPTSRKSGEKRGTQPRTWDDKVVRER